MRILVFAVLWILLFQVALAIQKPGICNRIKREQCQCAPHGTDDCSDECSEDTECYGIRKCCTVACKRICTVPPYYQTSQRCPPQQQWHPCPPPEQTSCPKPPAYCPQPPCPSPQPPAPEWSPYNCTPGCVCRPPYVPTGDGRCVHRTNRTCPPIPPPRPPICRGIHEIYYKCYRGCQASCDNPSAQGCVVSNCVDGCFCAPGFVRNRHGWCIRQETCPSTVIHKVPPTPSLPRCPQNQEFSGCRRQCEPSCAKPNPSGCYRRCQAGCFCRSPLVRDYDGGCVYPQECVKPTTEAPACDDRFEKYVFCSTKCQGTCDNPTGENCYARCHSGCVCVDGFVRDDNGQCIRIEECPPPTPPPPPPTPATPVCENDYEEYLQCHRGCERTCENLEGQGCTDECQSGCYCRPGFVRNHLGQCVYPHQCENLGCGYHEHFESCGPGCPITCPSGEQSTNDVVKRSTTGCNKPCKAGCFCDPGYIRNQTDHTCVPVDHCPYYYGQYHQHSYHCGPHEDAVPCGSLCERECAQGWSSESCPSTCRRRCCRRRFIR